MNFGASGWLSSRTYSIVIIAYIGSFVLDWWRDAGSWVVVVPAGFALIGGRMARDTKMLKTEPGDES
jgi:hypothetical protein